MPTFIEKVQYNYAYICHGGDKTVNLARHRDTPFCFTNVYISMSQTHRSTCTAIPKPIKLSNVRNFEYCLTHFVEDGKLPHRF